MKITQGEPKFRPVVITLETLDEVEWLAALAGWTGKGEGDVFFDKLYHELNSIAPGNYSKYKAYSEGGTFHLKRKSS